MKAVRIALPKERVATAGVGFSGQMTVVRELTVMAAEFSLQGSVDKYFYITCF
jgi:hypothetical protein